MSFSKKTHQNNTVCKILGFFHQKWQSYKAFLIYRYILLHPPTDCFPAEDYPSLSSPFTYALLLSHLTCKEHLFVTLLVLFISLFSFFLFLFICFMPVSLLFFLLPHYGLFSNVSFLLFISLGKFSFHLSLICFIDL